MAAKNKVGRPSDYLPEVADDICALLADGESLRSICKRPGMPNKSTIFRWLREHQAFCDQYAHAREVQAETLIEETLEIADDCIADPAEVAKAKLRVDTRKWFITKVAPKKYGELVKQEIDHKSSDGSMTPNNIDLSHLTFEQLQALRKNREK
ncbi:ubiquitin carboxyl-hydrolase [Xenorhabdus sp. PB61.4]|uniref:terminase small subunit-like protein n=1 Tax=Xenorhabdus sp. PB61.4 TaxID=2788940 RepID=UPI001E50BC67|nr:ubiquitin carboxyl-hydrolase [Xenorhabdus sp. PB61.4]MCC8367085.1 ubiquitin carboxyl-hydrolase [Xenorhabdus sp. PB61.4]